MKSAIIRKRKNKNNIKIHVFMARNVLNCREKYFANHNPSSLKIMNI